MMKLYLNDFEVDMFGDEVVAGDYAVNELGSLESRQGDGTNNFDLPMTNKNKLFFENANVVISGTLIPYQRLNARIEVNGLVQMRGFAMLTEVSEVFSIVVDGGNTDWFVTIGDKSIQDLDLDSLDHYFEPDTIRDYRENNVTWDTGVNYPNVDYGQWLSGDVFWYQFYPGVYFKYLLQRIWIEAGFTPVGNPWDNIAKFQKQFVPFAANFIRDRDYSKRNSGSWDEPTSTYDGTAGNFELVLTNTISSTVYNILNPYNADGRLVILDKCDLTFRLKVSVTNPFAFNRQFIFSIFYTDGEGVYQQEQFFSQILLPSETVVFENTFTRDVDRTDLEFHWFLFGGAAPEEGAVTLCEFEILDYLVDESTDEYLAIDPIFNYVTVASTLPDLKQIDLIRTFFNEYALMFSTDFLLDRINLFSFQDVNNNIPNARDWSSKLDISQKPRIRFMYEGYGQSNTFMYKMDDINPYLVAAPEYGKGYLTIENENLPTEVVIFESVFALVIRQSDSFSGTVRLAYIPKFDADNNQLDCEAYIGVIEFEDIHLLTMDGYAQETTQPAMHGLDISFLNLIPEFYDPVSGMLNFAKIVDALFNLKPIDIEQLDHSIPVYVDYFQAYFFIGMIQQFKFTHVESTPVQLAKLG